MISLTVGKTCIQLPGHFFSLQLSQSCPQVKKAVPVGSEGIQGHLG